MPCPNSLISKTLNPRHSPTSVNPDKISSNPTLQTQLANQPNTPWVQINSPKTPPPALLQKKSLQIAITPNQNAGSCLRGRERGTHQNFFGAHNFGARLFADDDECQVRVIDEGA